MIEKKAFNPATILAGFGGMNLGRAANEATERAGFSPKNKTLKGAKGILTSMGGWTVGSEAAKAGMGPLAAGLEGVGMASAAINPVAGLGVGLVGLGGAKLGNKLYDKFKPKPAAPTAGQMMKHKFQKNSIPIAAGAAGLYGLNKLRESRKKKNEEKQKEATIMSNENIYVDGLEKIASVTGYGAEDIHALLEHAENEMTKEASVEGTYIDGLEKIASVTGYGVEDVHTLLEHAESEMTKEASVEGTYIDGLEKIAQSTGINPELLDEGIAIFIEKQANEKIEAQSDADEAKTQAVNENLNKLAKYVDGLDDKKVEELLKGGK